MNKVICSSFFFGESVTQYANMKKKNINSHNEVYIKTVVCLFSSIRFFDKKSKLIFFVNDTRKLQSIKEGYYIGILEKLEVEVIEVPSQYVDTSKRWAGSMFIFDIIDFIVKTNENLEHDNQGYYFLDTDVIFLNDFETAINIIEKYDWAGYAQFSEFGRSNCWLENFHGIDFKTTSSPNNEISLPYGGEFLYLRSTTMIPFYNKFKTIFEEQCNFYFTEEHYYTSILNSKEFIEKKGLNINSFFKRAIRANRCLDDQYLWAGHFPGEKDYKLKYLFKYLEKNNFVYSPVKAKNILGVSTFVNEYDVKSVGKIIKGLARRINTVGR
ncbi:hypothetical protein [Priestia megaterium]|uniref:hypothetical protein n=1 Tax=Priestia megaterium TaxID=1404 RepID=UPI001C8DF57F|nr:hypothetical protein [Priestia megaterium]MBY0196840.1 hypothetical protein [Priestia megaterium]